VDWLDLGLIWCTDMHEWGGCGVRVGSEQGGEQPAKAWSPFRRSGDRVEDDAMLTMPDDEPDEERFVAIGIGSMGRVLVVVYTTRRDRTRIISARKATRQERSQYESRLT
jgi:uncharacterized DUF497 family protein